MITPVVWMKRLGTEMLKAKRGHVATECVCNFRDNSHSQLATFCVLIEGLE